MHFICSSFNYKYNIRFHRLFFLASVAIMATIITALNHTAIYEGFLGILYSLWFFIFSLFFLNGTVLKKLFISVFTNVILIGVSTGITNIMSLILKDSLDDIYTQQEISRLLTVVITQAALTYVFGILNQVISKKIGSLKPKEWLLIVLVFVLSFAAFTAIHTTAINSQTDDNSITLLIVAEFCMFLINVVCWHITVSLSKMRKNEEELLALAKQNEYNTQYSEIVKSQYEQTRRLRHDMKQYCVVLGKLLSDQNYNEAQALVSENYGNIISTDVVVDIGNEFVNAILNVKLSIAKSFGISVICSVEKNISGFKSTDLCSLIGNLLDNAIEAAKQCNLENRSIEFNMASLGSSLNIIVRNSIVASVLTYNAKLSTTKKNSLEHGFGIKTIKHITEKYNGTTDFYEENHTFISHIRIYRNE